MLQVGLLVPDAEKRMQQNKSQSAIRDGQHDFDFRLALGSSILKTPAESVHWFHYLGELGNAIVSERYGMGALISMNSGAVRSHIRPDSAPTIRKLHQLRLRPGKQQASGADCHPPSADSEWTRRVFCQDTLNDRAILVRYVWSGHHPKFATSNNHIHGDGVKTWEVNWISTMTRTQPPADQGH